MLIYSIGKPRSFLASSRETQPDASTSTFSFSFSSVAVVAGTVLPYLADRDRRLLAPDLLEEDEDLNEEEREFKRIKELVSEWKAEAKRDSKELRLPTSELYRIHSFERSRPRS